MSGLESPRFWQPEFDYERRADGTVLMWQKEDLPDHLPLVAGYLDKWAKEAPDRTWLARRGEDGNWRRISYSEAREIARKLGSALLGLGLGPKKPLLILSENSLEHALLGAACSYVGIPFAPVSPAYSLVSDDLGKIRDIVATLDPGALFADDGVQFSRALEMLRDGRVIINQRNLVNDALSFDDLLDGDPTGADEARKAITPDTIVKYLFTSGSTGSPKAVINTNRMITAMAAMTRDCYRYLEHEPPVVVDWAPWNHTAAGNKTFYLVLTNGGTYYIDNGRPVRGKFEETLRNLREISCTWYFNVPVGYDMLVEALEEDEALAKTFFAKLGMLFYAGAGMAQHTWDALMALGKKYTGREFLLATGLGATETAPFALAWTEPEKKAGNVGVPSRGLILKLVPNGGKLEARLKGPTITPGYLNEPEKTREAFDEEGFYCLGDALRPADPDDLSRGFFFDGRVAENFKLNTGTWVSVGAVRAGLVDAMGGLIRDAVIVGENERELGALVLLSDSAGKLSPHDLEVKLTEKLALSSAAATGSASRVNRIVVLDEPPSFDRGEVTEKGSLNQRALRAHNEALISRLYAGGEGVITV